MNKSEFVAAVAEKSGSTQKDVNAVFNAMTQVIAEALKKGDKVALAGFANFEVGTRAARQGRNPRTGEVLNIAAAKTVKIKALAGLKSAVE